MNENYYKFYEMVKNWTVSDYCTPGIKAEVILDMLISEFIEDLIRYHYYIRENKEYEVTLLAKEFPLQIYEENNRNAKVDYLVSVGSEKLVLVELKSTNDSYNKKQKDRMKQAVGRTAKKLVKFFVELKVKDSSDRRKYEYVLKKFKKNLVKAQFDVEKCEKIEYMYVSLTESGSLPENKLILTEYYKNEKFSNALKDEERRELWKNVSDILLKCVEELEKGKVKK